MPEGLQRQRIHVGEESDVYNAAMLAYSLVQQTGARALLATESATVVSELGMNIIRYAGHGSLTLSLEGGARGYLEVLAEDKGPGILDVGQAMTESFSSRGTLGLGLPGVRRMSDTFDIRSSPGAGTTVRARRNFNATPRAAAALPLAPATPALVQFARVNTGPAGSGEWQHALARRPCYGEVVSGDGSLVQPLARGLLAAIIDVLGHGEQAHTLARFCERWLATHAHADVADLVQNLHREIKGSVGAALTLAYLDIEARSMTVVGVGNTRLYGLRVPSLCIDAQPGIVGGSNLPRLRATVVPIAPQDVLLFTSDGISEQLDVQDLQAIRHHPVHRIAQQVLRDHGKDYDDATCLVLRCPTS